MPHTQTKMVSDLSKSDDIVLLEQDKGRGGVLMDRSKYIEKSKKKNKKSSIKKTTFS